MREITNHQGSAQPPPLQALPGRLAVMLRVDDPSAIIVVPDYIKRKEEEFGLSNIEVRPGRVFSSGFHSIPDGCEVYFRLNAAGDIYGPTDYPFIPEGHELWLLGIKEPIFAPRAMEPDPVSKDSFVPTYDVVLGVAA